MAVQNIKAAGRVALATLLVMLTVGCSYVYDVRFHVGVSPGTTAPVYLEVVDAYGVAERNVVMPAAGQNRVSASVSVCCAPEPVVTLQAYVDVNNSGRHEPGEPLSVWPGGPVRLTGNTTVQLNLSTTVPSVASPAAGSPTVTTP